MVAKVYRLVPGRFFCGPRFAICVQFVQETVSAREVDRGQCIVIYSRKLLPNARPSASAAGVAACPCFWAVTVPNGRGIGRVVTPFPSFPLKWEGELRIGMKQETINAEYEKRLASLAVLCTSGRLQSQMQEKLDALLPSVLDRAFKGDL
jgi:hypothetical protein